MGSPADPWRTAEAWLHHRRVDGLQVHGQTSRAAVADLADVSPYNSTCCPRCVRLYTHRKAPGLPKGTRVMFSPAQLLYDH